MSLPAGDDVLSKESRGAYRLIVFVVGWFIAGVAATVAVFSIMGAQGHASPDAGVAAQLVSIVSDISAIKRDVAAIKCRVNLEGVCPP